MAPKACGSTYVSPCCARFRPLRCTSCTACCPQPKSPGPRPTPTSLVTPTRIGRQCNQRGQREEVHQGRYVQWEQHLSVIVWHCRAIFVFFIAENCGIACKVLCVFAFCLPLLSYRAGMHSMLQQQRRKCCIHVTDQLAQEDCGAADTAAAAKQSDVHGAAGWSSPVTAFRVSSTCRMQQHGTLQLLGSSLHDTGVAGSAATACLQAHSCSRQAHISPCCRCAKLVTECSSWFYGEFLLDTVVGRPCIALFNILGLLPICCPGANELFSMCQCQCQS